MAVVTKRAMYRKRLLKKRRFFKYQKETEEPDGAEAIEGGDAASDLVVGGVRTAKRIQLAIEKRNPHTHGGKKEPEEADSQMFDAFIKEIPRKESFAASSVSEKREALPCDVRPLPNKRVSGRKRQTPLSERTKAKEKKKRAYDTASESKRRIALNMRLHSSQKGGEYARKSFSSWMKKDFGKLLYRLPVVFLAGVFFFCTCISSIGQISSSLPANTVIAEAAILEGYLNRIDQLDQKLEKEIRKYQNMDGYDDIRIDAMGEDGEVKTNWPELISLVAVNFDQNLRGSFAEYQYIELLYHKMRFLETRTERFFCRRGCCVCGSGVPHCHGDHVRLVVENYSYGMEDIIEELGFNELQISWARTLAASQWEELFPQLGRYLPMESSSQEVYDRLVTAQTTSTTRESICQTALSLVGRVPYFWGGKSAAGWNPQWGKMVKVTAAGSSTTGSNQPYGLDCSGFVDWVYKTAGAGTILSSGGTAYQWEQSYTVSESDLKPGDLVFKQRPGTSGTNHVGIYVGKDENNRNLYCHCTYGKGVVVNHYTGFKYFRRPYLIFDGET